MDEKNRTVSPAKRVAVGKEEQGSERSFRRRQKRSRADFATTRCWAHVRRKFDEALNALPPDRREGTTAYTGLEYCNKLFAWEEQFKGLSPEEQAKQRLREETPILDTLLEWADSVSAAPKSVLGKALHYLKEQWPYLLRYLKDGRPELSQPGGAQHQALCDWPQELPVCQYPAGPCRYSRLMRLSFVQLHNSFEPQH